MLDKAERTEGYKFSSFQWHWPQPSYQVIPGMTEHANFSRVVPRSKRPSFFHHFNLQKTPDSQSKKETYRARKQTDQVWKESLPTILDNLHGDHLT